MLSFGGSTGDEEFKTVDEIWDKGVGGYKTVESPGSAEYPFVVRRRFGKPNTDYKICIDITSEGLRAIVRQALEDAKDASSCNMFKESITVDLDALLNCLPQLEECLAFQGFTLPGDVCGKHLKKLMGFLLPLREIDTPPVTHSREVDILSIEQEQPQPVDYGF
ncbi:MAG: hypothetical protein M1840_003837 [Geoglossum simile]|nr:MAG: hypothetical protein M1840_003837 [Geoglossum simile]